MGTRPFGGRTKFATDSTYTSGPFTGQPNKLALLSGEKAQGWHPSKRPPAEKFNSLEHERGEWEDYLGDVSMQNWYPPIGLDQFSATFDTSYVRSQAGLGALSATADIFFSTIHNRWIMCGSATAGTYFVVDQGLAQKLTATAGSPPNVAFGCEVGDRVLLFSGHTVGATTAFPYLRSASNAILAGSWTKLDIFSGGPQAASAAYVGKIINAEDILANMAIACGGVDGNYTVWYTTDAGATFVQQTVGAVIGTPNYLDRIVKGAVHVGITPRLIAFNNASSGNGGNKLWYSDGGPTGPWNSATFADTGIVDIVFDPHSKLYFVLSAQGSKLYATSDPIAGSLTTLISLTSGSYPKLTALACHGDAVIYSAAVSATDATIAMIPTPGAGSKVVHRIWSGGGLGSGAVPGSITVSDYGQFGLMVPEGIAQLSFKSESR